MFSSPGNFLKGAAMIAVGALLIAATGGAAAPVLVAAGVAGGAIQFGTSAYKAAQATTDDEAKAAWEGMGAGTSAVAMSVAGAKSAAKAAGVETEGKSALKATAECFKQSTSAIGKSVKAFSSGEFVTNLGFGKSVKETAVEEQSVVKEETPKQEPEVEEQPVAKKETPKQNKYDTLVEDEAKKILSEYDESQIEKFKNAIKDCEEIEYSNETVGHATSAENAKSIQSEGYNIIHESQNNGSNNFGGMDVEAESIQSFGNKYGNQKLEYKFSGKALKLTNEMSEKFRTLVNETDINGDSLLMKSMNTALKNDKINPGDLPNAVIRQLLQKLGYDAIAVAPQGKTLFLTILNPNNSKSLQFIRQVSL